MDKIKDVIIVGGGAAGFFSAINIASINPKLNILILERGSEGLQKVKISGGGRCNVTHAEFIPSELVLNYPRGEKELLGPFHQFMTGDTIQWFEDRGIVLKTENDGRMFPESNNSQTIIDCFLSEVKKLNIDILYNSSVKEINPNNNQWIVSTDKNKYSAKKLLISTGSNIKIWNIIKSLDHSIINPVPSLFSFNIKDERIDSIQGVTIKNVVIKVINTNLVSTGPLLITHNGLSAPSILKLSAFGATEFSSFDYKFNISINFINLSKEECLNFLKNRKLIQSKKFVINSSLFDLSKRFWKKLILYSNIPINTKWADLNKEQLEILTNLLTNSIFTVNGKSTHKDEFVTAGGVDLKEINFKTFESKIHKNLYFAGEVLNIDAVTGGFNFQNAWTSGYIASQAIAQSN